MDKNKKSRTTFHTRGDIALTILKHLKHNFNGNLLMLLEIQLMELLKWNGAATSKMGKVVEK